jgi:hypothetical protein
MRGAAQGRDRGEGGGLQRGGYGEIRAVELGSELRKKGRKGGAGVWSGSFLRKQASACTAVSRLARRSLAGAGSTKDRHKMMRGKGEAAPAS